MKAESYTQAVQMAWKLTWSRKRLWILGLLAGLVGSGGSFEFVFNYFSALDGKSEELSDVVGLFVATFTGNADFIWGAAAASFASLVVIAAIILIAISGQGGLIKAVSVAEKSGTKLNIAQLVRGGKKHLAPLFAINFVKALLIALLLYVTQWSVLLLSESAGAWAAALLVLMSIVVLVLGLSVSFLAIYSACYVMLAEKKFKEAVLDSWALFRSHWMVSLEMAVVVFLVGLLMVVVALGGLMAVGAPAFLALAIGAISGSSAFVGFALASSFVVAVLWLMLVGAIYTTFAVSAWTILFMQMRDRGLSSKMKAWLRKLLKR